MSSNKTFEMSNICIFIDYEYFSEREGGASVQGEIKRCSSERGKEGENSCGAQTVPDYMVRSEAADPDKRRNACG